MKNLSVSCRLSHEFSISEISTKGPLISPKTMSSWSRLFLFLWAGLSTLLALKLECRIISHVDSQILHQHLSSNVGLLYFAVLSVLNGLLFVWIFRKGTHLHDREPMGFRVSVCTILLLGLALE